MSVKWTTGSAGTLKIFLETGVVDSVGRHVMLTDSLATIFRKTRSPRELMELSLPGISGVYKEFAEKEFSSFSEAVKIGAYDCENLSVLLFDAYRKAGFEPQFVFFPLHVGIEVGGFIIEPSKGKWYPSSNCPFTKYWKTPDSNKAVQIFVLFNQATKAKTMKEYAMAIGLLEKAKEIAPEIPDTYHLLALIYSKLGDYKKTSEELIKYSKLFK